MLHAYSSSLGSNSCIKGFSMCKKGFVLVALNSLDNSEHTSGDRPLSSDDIRLLEYFSSGVASFKKFLLHWYVQEKANQMSFFIVLQI